MVRFAKTFIGIACLLLMSCSPEEQDTRKTEKISFCQTREVYGLSQDLALMPKLHPSKNQRIRERWWCEGDEGLLRLRPKGEDGEEVAKYLIKDYEDSAIHFKIAPGKEPGEAVFFTITVGGEQ